MADLHHHHETPVVADREGPATALIAILVLTFVAIMLWLFLGTNVIVDHNNGNTPSITKIENNPQGGSGAGGNGGTGVTGGGTAPQPATSP
jgi:hypothetical protein